MGNKNVAGEGNKTGVENSGSDHSGTETTTNLGGFDLGVSYRQDMAESSDGSRYHLGPWAWDMTYVDISDSGTRVVFASGETFDAQLPSTVAPDGVSSENPSGLLGYPYQDRVRFSQKAGSLPARAGISSDVFYSYTLETVGEGTEFFNANGDLVARIGVFGDRVDVLWVDGHYLIGVVDAADSRVDALWKGIWDGKDGTVEMRSPERSDGSVSITVFSVMSKKLESVINPVGEKTRFEYSVEGDLNPLRGIISPTGAITEIKYQFVNRALALAVDKVRVLDGATGEELSYRTWTCPTSPSNENESENDSQTQTVLSDGYTQVVSTYNYADLMVARDILVSTPLGDLTVQAQKFAYAQSERYAHPIQTTVDFIDSNGRNRTVTETNEYTTAGQVQKHVGADGMVTETVYDTQVPEKNLIGEEAHLPVGLVLKQISCSLVSENSCETTHGLLSETVNIPAANHKSIQNTETLVGNLGELASTSRTETVVDSDGFVSEQRVVATSPFPQDPQTVVTRFERVVDRDHKTVTLIQTNAAGTAVESRSSVVADLPTGLTLSTDDPTGRRASTSYDAAGRPVSETDYAGLITATETAIM